MSASLHFDLPGFDYPDLYRAEHLPLLDKLFLEALAQADPAFALRYVAYRKGEACEGPAESALLIAVARHTEDFLVRTFRVTAAREALRVTQARDEVIHAFKEKFVKHRARKKRAIPAWPFFELDALLPITPGEDREHAVATLWSHADTAQETALLALLEEWVHAAFNSPVGRAATHGWVSLQLPQRIEHLKLVPIEAVPRDSAARAQGPAATRRARDGFNLTDPRFSLRETMDQVHYCVYCHDHGGDFCSRGFPEKEGTGFRKNPLEVELAGCPLGEKISEAHALKRDGYTLGALAMIMVDNPLLPATGHRICNDCMTSCVYQKQDPVDIPQIETRILTDVLSWPWGFEIYFLLTRWNPLHRARPYRQPYQGGKVLVVGAGPAGFNLAQHLLQDGFGVVMVDGLKIEPLPEYLVGRRGVIPLPVQRVEDLFEPLDGRSMAGFGGVAEYGITIRWDKNFLKLVRIVLARSAQFSLFGGVRLGGTLTLEDAAQLGFDHVTLATGAGRPTVLPMKNNMAQGIRQASDFLMALQLTGAAKRESLANLQLRLPAVVIGGGLTAIDTATEVQAYYIRQVEKLLARWEALAAADQTQPAWSEMEAEILAEFLNHGRAVRAERERAQRTGQPPDFARLIHAWGGVTVAYRRAMSDSPAYLRNHEEISKALEEGIYYAENLEPAEALLDAHHHVSALRLRRVGSDEIVTLPARAVFVAAGSIPNTVYEREHPGTFVMEGKFFAAHRIDEKGELVRVSGAGNNKSAAPGFFTSYAQGALRVSFIGDTHPQFHGSVVKAMASGKRAAQEISKLLSPQMARPQHAPDHAWFRFAAELEQRLQPQILKVEQLAAHLTRLTVRAPQAVQNWRPGQVYRLQNFDSRSERLQGIPLTMEGMAITGIQVDKARGEIQLVVNSVGASSRIAASLKPGAPVILMGPTGTGLPVPQQGAITVIGGSSAVTSTIEGAASWRAAGNRILFIGHFKSQAQARVVQSTLEILTDQAIWILDQGPELILKRKQDRCFVHGVDEFLDACAESDGAHAAWVAESDCIILSDHPGAMQQFSTALQTRLKSELKPELLAVASVNSPMQCMMKEVCAQCLCRHVNPATGETSKFVFSCFNQHQPLFDLDFANLQARQGQNSVQEKISDAWLSHVSGASSTATDKPQPVSDPAVH
ncbi:MAG: FAD-dependent oxidoreductase [Burkholderiales bacterium]|nr:FAD-dependent oxidoreductase [Burkholderiales bacterium]